MYAPTYAHPARHRQPNFRYSEAHAPTIGRDAPADVREVWHNAYNKSVAYYTRERAPYPDNLARNSAWKTIKLYWEEPRHGRFRMRNPNEGVLSGVYKGEPIYIGDEQPFPAPGETATLCKLIELTWISADGNLQVQRFTEPGLPDVFWNRKTRTLYAFPHSEPGQGQCVLPEHGPRKRAPRGILANLARAVGLGEQLSTPDDTFIGLEDQVKMYEIWTNGRPPTCRNRIMVPDEPIIAYGVADTIVYRSDKWQDEPNPHPDKHGSQEYLHQFGLDVAIEEAPARGKNAPLSVVIRGGKLDVLEGGIAH